LTDVFSQDKYSETLKALVIDYLPQIVQGVLEIDFGLFYDVIETLILHVDLGDYVIKLCQNLTKRIQKVSFFKFNLHRKSFQR
jgi:hypothetical protein